MDIDTPSRSYRSPRRPSMEETPSYFDQFLNRKQSTSQAFTEQNTPSFSTGQASRTFKSHRSSSYIPFGTGKVTSENIVEALSKEIPNISHSPVIQKPVEEKENIPNFPREEFWPSRSLFSGRKHLRRRTIVKQSFDTWVVISGFNFEQVGKEVIKYFSQKEFGEIQEVKVFQKSNFIFVKYLEERSVHSALEKNGQTFSFGSLKLLLSVSMRERVQNDLDHLIENEALSLIATIVAQKKEKSEKDKSCTQKVYSACTKFVTWLIS
eukprot:snap_masked-scaffold_21-processed-gene-1.16-mRNA-1 protein AED:1.00 eAED:1.00 QI:0/-1/0/0/-1/1/1/0/265